MVFLIDGVTLDEAPQSISQLYLQFGQLREQARLLVDKRREVVNSVRSLYLTVREYAITHTQDTKVDILGTDNLVNNVVIIIKNPGNYQLGKLYVRCSIVSLHVMYPFLLSLIQSIFYQLFNNFI